MRLVLHGIPFRKSKHFGNRRHPDGLSRFVGSLEPLTPSCAT